MDFVTWLLDTRSQAERACGKPLAHFSQQSSECEKWAWALPHCSVHSTPRHQELSRGSSMEDPLPTSHTGDLGIWKSQEPLPVAQLLLVPGRS